MTHCPKPRGKLLSAESPGIGPVQILSTAISLTQYQTLVKSRKRHCRQVKTNTSGILQAKNAEVKVMHVPSALLGKCASITTMDLI